MASAHGNIVYTFTPKTRSRRRIHSGVGLREYAKRLVLMVVLGGSVLMGGFLGHEYYEVSHLRQEVKALVKRHAALKATYDRLTSKKVVYAKARALGLCEAKPEQIVRIR